MFSKVKSIICDFYTSLSTKEKLGLLSPIPIILIYFYFFSGSMPSSEINEYILSINDATLTTMALLLAFGLGVVTLLFSSGSKSIQKAKEYYPNNIKNKDNIPLNYYELILIRIYYSLIIQVFMVLFSLIVKILFHSTTSIIIVSIESIILLHAILVEFKIIISMYHLMWKD